MSAKTILKLNNKRGLISKKSPIPNHNTIAFKWNARTFIRKNASIIHHESLEWTNPLWDLRQISNTWALIAFVFLSGIHHPVLFRYKSSVCSEACSKFCSQKCILVLCQWKHKQIEGAWRDQWAPFEKTLTIIIWIKMNNNTE